VKFLNWCVGVMQILTGVMLAWSLAPAWRWVWIPIGVVWFFVGCALGLTGLAKLVSEKWKMGAARPTRAGAAHAPTDNKED